MEAQINTKKTVFGAGCFWGVESAFRQVKGVVDVVVGYSGGHKENPTYEEVYSGSTGHAEVAQVEYDPAIIPYETLVRKFFKMHDSTTMNRQGPDVGEQYRSTIFWGTPEEKEIAEKVKDELDGSGKYPTKIATQIVPAAPFYRAEEYHQRYNEKHGTNTCP